MPSLSRRNAITILMADDDEEDCELRAKRSRTPV